MQLSAPTYMVKEAGNNGIQQEDQVETVGIVEAGGESAHLTAGESQYF